MAPAGKGLFLGNVINPILYRLRRQVNYRGSNWDVHEFGLSR